MNEWGVVLQSLKDHGKGMLVGVMIGGLIALVITLFQTPVWRTTMIVGPTENASIPSLGSFISKAAADAPALQYFVERIDAGQSTDFTLYETMIDSPQILEKMLQQDDVTVPQQNLDDLRRWMDQNFAVRAHGMTGFKRIMLDHTDKNAAPIMLAALHNITDQTIRADKAAKTEKRISYLNQQLNRTRNADHRDALIALLKEEEQIAMMIAIDDNFAAQVIAPPILSVRPIAPNPVILFPVLMGVGVLVGLIFSQIRHAVLYSFHQKKNVQQFLIELKKEQKQIFQTYLSRDRNQT